MKALCWQGKESIELKYVNDPTILSPGDAIIKVTTAAIGGSDLLLYDGVIPTIQKGDILGHETMGEVVEIGRAVKKIKVGDRIVIPFDIGCGHCHHCKAQEYSACDNTNPNAFIAEKLYGGSGAGLFGFSRLHGGYAGVQVEYIRVPYADVNSLMIPSGISDEKVLFLSDIFPTGYAAVENCNVKRGQTIAVWGAGPVGQMAIRSAFLLGAERVISIDHYNGRLKMARQAGAEIINYESEEHVIDELKYRTGGLGPDACIDAVGLATNRPNVLRQAIQAVRKCGTVSVPGLYAGLLDKIPFGAAFSKSLTIKMGQTHTQKYMKPLLEEILADKFDPSFVITHRVSLAQGPTAYKMFKEEKDACIKVIIKM